MSTCQVSISYALSGAEHPRFTLEPGDGRFAAESLRSVDRLELRWSTPSMDDQVRAYLAKIGSKGGKKSTPAKAEAARENAKRGGRPKGAKDSKPRTRTPRRKQRPI